MSAGASVGLCGGSLRGPARQHKSHYLLFLSIISLLLYLNHNLLAFILNVSNFAMACILAIHAKLSWRKNYSSSPTAIAARGDREMS